MQRRRFLRGFTAAGIAGAAGCGRLDSTVEGPRIDDWTFETGRSPDDRDPDVAPAVAFDDEHDRVVVRGHVYYGSSSCNEAQLERLADDPDADRLRVEVGYGSEGLLPSLACTADIAGTFYRVRIHFVEGLPETVTVLENNSGFEDERRTVERGQS